MHAEAWATQLALGTAQTRGVDPVGTKKLLAALTGVGVLQQIPRPAGPTPKKWRNLTTSEK